MPFTGRIGSADSRLGNWILGYGSSRRGRVPFRRSGRTPFYRVQVFEVDPAANFGYGDLIAEFDRFKNLGYADYLNNVPEAFFTLMQDDPKITALRGKGGRAHVRIWRSDRLVWTGWVSMERDANSDDAIFYCYGYLAGLYWLHTDWQQTWTDENIGTIVSDAWIRAKTTLTNSKVGFINTGAIESPPTTAGGSTEIILPTYEAYYKRILFLVQEMAAIAGSDTGNTTAFEISNAITPGFAFRADIARTLTETSWTYGDGKVQTFREYGMPVYHRNDVLAVGQQPRDLILRKQVEDTVDMADDWGRMQESLFLAWVRDEDELTRVTNLRAAKAKRDDLNITLGFYPGAEAPPGAQERWRNGDIVPVKIDRGVTSIDGNFQIVGYMAAVMNGQEKMNVLIQEPIS